MPDPKDRAKRAVVLLSGGLDSATVAAELQRDGWRVHALTVDYGQRHSAELAAARSVAEALSVAEHVVITVGLGAFGGSALTDAAIAVPKEIDPLAPVATSIPVTYVPARNLVLLALAAAFAEARGAQAIGIGVNALDYSGYPDCRPEYIESFERMANLATRAGVEGRGLRVHTPLIAMTKAEIVKLGQRLGVDYGLTWSCYDPTPQGTPCGRCDACLLREKGFREAGVNDPAQIRDMGSGYREAR
jgi:7-cyano-7-deazaguanine synthase